MSEEEHLRRVRRAKALPRDWRQVHHSPLFWLGVLLFVAAIGFYVWSDDLSWRPRIEHAQAPAPG